MHVYARVFVYMWSNTKEKRTKSNEVGDLTVFGRPGAPPSCINTRLQTRAHACHACPQYKHDSRTYDQLNMIWTLYVMFSAPACSFVITLLFLLFSSSPPPSPLSLSVASGLQGVVRKVASNCTTPCFSVQLPVWQPFPITQWSHQMSKQKAICLN